MSHQINTISGPYAHWPWDAKLDRMTRRELVAEVCRWQASSSRLTLEIVRLRDELAKEQAKNVHENSNPAGPEGNHND